MALFGRKKYLVINVRKKDVPKGLWEKCPACNEIVYKEAVRDADGICPKCSHHFPIGFEHRLRLLADPGSWREQDADLASADPLAFSGRVTYAEKLSESRDKSGVREAIACGSARIGGRSVHLGIMDFAFLGGSMGAVVGEKVARLFESAVEAEVPVIIVCASGGARMYEGMYSLMQMAKTSAAVAAHHAQGLGYVSVLTHPTTAGVMASFASLGDIMIAEPGALIGFAGPRVIRETTREEVPPGFQRAEFVLDHGLVDMVVHRNELKRTLQGLLGYLAHAPLSAPAGGADSAAEQKDRS